MSDLVRVVVVTFVFLAVLAAALFLPNGPQHVYACRTTLIGGRPAQLCREIR